MSEYEKHAQYQRMQLSRLDNVMARMLHELIPIESTPFRAVWEARAKLEASMGFKLPRPVFSLLSLFGLSPGTLTLWLDSETGYFVEAREKPGAPAVYHAVGDAVAMTILKGELTHEQFEDLKIPDPYLGE